MKKLYITFTFIVALASHAFGQQDPLYGLYITNPIMINPAYSGFNNGLEVSAGYRHQWAGFDGSPTTTYASANTSAWGNKMGAGFFVVSDKIGENKNTTANASGAYKLSLGNNQTLSFGLSAGMISYKSDASMLTLQTTGDPVFNSTNTSKLNLGAGALLKGDKFVIGLSVPHLLDNATSRYADEINVYERHYYLMGTYFFHLSDRIIFKPGVLLKGVKGSPLSADINMNISIDKKYAVGLFTRNLNTCGLLAQFTLMEKLKLAYALEVPSNKSVGTRFTTNEIMLMMRINAFKFQKYDSAPSLL